MMDEEQKPQKLPLSSKVYDCCTQKILPIPSTPVPSPLMKKSLYC